MAERMKLAELDPDTLASTVADMFRAQAALIAIETQAAWDNNDPRAMVKAQVDLAYYVADLTEAVARLWERAPAFSMFGPGNRADR